jgi:hypothetical protein
MPGTLQAAQSIGNAPTRSPANPTHRSTAFVIDFSLLALKNSPRESPFLIPHLEIFEFIKKKVLPFSSLSAKRCPVQLNQHTDPHRIGTQLPY